MRLSTRVAPLLLATLAACGKSGPISFAITTPTPTGDAYTCTLRKINELGYTVTNTNREAGFITGSKTTSTGLSRALSGNQWQSVLTVSIFDEPNTTDRRIRVSAGQVRERSNLFTTSTSAEKPNEQGLSDARALLNACGQGEITQVSLGAFVASGQS